MGVGISRVFDISCLPFTRELKTIWSHNEEIRKGMEKTPGLWEKFFSAESLRASLDEAGVECVLMPAQACGSWNVPPEGVLRFAEALPGRVYGLFGIDPRNI